MQHLYAFGMHRSIRLGGNRIRRSPTRNLVVAANAIVERFENQEARLPDAVSRIDACAHHRRATVSGADGAK
jgi:hypothetical protein